MHRFRVGIALVAVAVVGCDPVVHASLRVTPPVGSTVDSTTRDKRSLDAIGAVERVALQFGLTPGESRSPLGPKAWRGKTYSGNHPEQLGVYAHVDATGILHISVSEILASRWSPRGDSLRKALAHTLTSFGAVTPEPPNER